MQLSSLHNQDSKFSSTRRMEIARATIGYQIKTYRRQRGITLEGLAKASDISTGMASKIENGGVSPSLTTLAAISTALSLPLTSLLGCLDEKHQAIFVSANQTRNGFEPSHECNDYNDLRVIENGNGSFSYSKMNIMKNDYYRINYPNKKGVIFIFMIHGVISIEASGENYLMSTGDSIMFNIVADCFIHNNSCDNAAYVLYHSEYSGLHSRHKTPIVKKKSSNLVDL